MKNGYAFEFLEAYDEDACFQELFLRAFFVLRAEKYEPMQSDKIRQFVESRFQTNKLRFRSTMIIQPSSFLTSNLPIIC